MGKIDWSERRESHLLLLILIFLLAVRLGVFLSNYWTAPSRILESDSFSYDSSAKALLKIGRFAVSPDKPGTPQTMRTPGYPIFIAAVYAMFGVNHLSVIVTQILISIGTVIITYLTARLLWNSRVALLSALVLSLDIPSFTYSQMLRTETLFTFVIMVAVASGVRLILKKKPLIKYGLLLGIALSSAALIRPISYYLIFPILVGFFVFGKVAHWKRKEITAVILLMVLPWVILVEGWRLRNFLATGSSVFSCISDASLLHYRAAEVIAHRDGITPEEARQKIYASLPDTKGWPREKSHLLYARKGSSLICRYPLLYIKVMVKWMMRMMVSPGDTHLTVYLGIKDANEKTGPLGDLLRCSFSQYLRKYLLERPLEFIIFVLALAYLLILYTATIYSLCQMGSIKRGTLSAHLFILGIIVYFLIISAGPEAYSRFRVPIMPLLAVYAGEGINHFLYLSNFLRKRVSARSI